MAIDGKSIEDYKPRNWVELADDVAKMVGLDPVILKATIEAEYSGENKPHAYLPKYDQSAIGYGGVLLYYWANKVEEAAKLIGVDIPNWAKSPSKHPTGKEARRLGDLLLQNDELSMATTALVVKYYWDRNNRNFTQFTKGYVGPKVPAEDIERRRRIYNKWKNNPSSSDIPNYNEKTSNNKNTGSSTDEWREGQKFYTEGGKYDGPAHEGMSGVVEKPTGVAPHYYEDDFTKLMHRYTQGDFYFRIGDARFVVPPTQIRVSEQSNIQYFKSIRQKQSMKTQSGNKMKTIELTLMFTDFNQINGYEMPGPNGDTYYMDGLRSLLAQMKTMPFLPIENEYLNLVHDISSVAILSANVSTVQGFPAMLQADLTLVEFNAEVYLNKPSMFYEHHFMWPLFRWHYQRLLNARTRQYDLMAPYVGDDSISFSYLDEAVLERKEKEIRKENGEKLKQGEREATWFDYNGEFTDSSDSNLYKKHHIPTSFEIVNITGSAGNTLTPLTPQLLGKPAFQYFGNQDTRFNLLIHTNDRNTIRSFRSLKDQVDRYAREYRDRFVSSMLKVQNNFINMMGIESVLIEGITVSTVEGSPGSFYIAMSLVSYDDTQYRDEKLGRIDTYDIRKGLRGNMVGSSFENFDNNITHEVEAERQLNQLELYPDLDLPTYEEVNKILPEINKWRVKRGFSTLPVIEFVGPSNSKYVDPDFFFTYPALEDLIDNWEKSLNDPKVQEMNPVDLPDKEATEALKKIEAIDAKEYFGPKTIAQLEKADPNGKKKLKETYEALNMSDPSAIASHLDQYRIYIHDSKNYMKRFWTRAWKPDKVEGHWEEPSSLKGDNMDVLEYKKQSPVASVKDLSKDDMFKGMMHDMYKYDRRGTMMRAFPTYCLVLIDEGMIINANKLWDNYYTYHSVSEINIHMDRKNPIHTAYIRLSNVYGALNNQDKFGRELSDVGLGNVWDAIASNFVKDVTEKELYERKLVYESIQLLAGARLHIRMGYGASASQLPVMFNGIIAEMNNGEVVDIVAQSFGHELTNQIQAAPGETNTVPEQGLEATEIFRYYLSQRNSNYTFAWRERGVAEKYQSAYGIEHFGALRIRDERGISDTFNGWYFNHEKEMNAEDYDLMKNVYSTKGYYKYGTDEGYEGGDEINVRMELSGKATWDVFRTLERVTPEYIVYPHTHQFHYTVFFGKPWWDVQCGYILPPLKDEEKPDKYGEKVEHYVELTKPFSQMHFYTGYGDILRNNIIASGTNLITAVTPLFSQGTGIGQTSEKHDIIWADYYIRGSFQKMRTVDTTLVQNLSYVFDWMEKFGSFITDWMGESKYEKHAIRFAQGVLADSFKDMYQGELVVIGDPSAKPYDIFYMDDIYSQMNGTAEIGRVVHMMSVDTGFISTIKPDLGVIKNPEPETYSEDWPINDQAIAGNYFRYSHMIQIGTLYAWKYYSYYKLGQFVLSGLPRVIKAVKIPQAVIAGNTFVHTLAASNKLKTAKIGKGLISVGSGIRRITLGVRGALLGTAAISSSVPGPGWAVGALAVASIVATEALIKIVENTFVQKYNNTIKIFPLFHKGVPYVAGINGHKSLIPGWEDNGSGQLVRVEIDNSEKEDPVSVSEIEGFSGMDETQSNSYKTSYGYGDPRYGATRKYSADKTDETAFVSDIPPSKWVKGIDKDNNRANAPMFYSPVAISSKGSGDKFSAMKARLSRGFHPSSDPDHQGLDFGGRPNRDILAFAEGKVVYVGKGSGYGNAVIIRHDVPQYGGKYFTFYTLYAHMKKRDIEVKEGQHVYAGQRVALMGSEGVSSGVHLHFEIAVPKDAQEAAKKQNKVGKSHYNYYVAKGPDKVNDPRKNMKYYDPIKFMASIIANNHNLFSYVYYK